MSDDKRWTCGWRVVLSMVGATLGLLIFLAVGCGDLSGGCSCAAPDSEAVIAVIPLACETPVVTTMGPCTAALALLAYPQENSQELTLTPTGAGACHVDVTFGSGATSSVDVVFVQEWLACGSDPHGCGQAFVPANQMSVAQMTCDVALDAAASD